MSEHAREHVVQQQANILGEHTEDKPVDEMRHQLRGVTACA